jgi:hypothetical protein
MLHAVQRDMGGVEIDGIDFRRRAREIGQHVAAARSNGDDAVALPKLHRFHVDIGVFPDLRIDKPGKEQGEQALRKPFLRQSAVLVDRFSKALVAGETDFRRDVGHGKAIPHLRCRKRVAQRHDRPVTV